MEENACFMWRCGAEACGIHSEMVYRSRENMRPQSVVLASRTTCSREPVPRMLLGISTGRRETTIVVSFSGVSFST
jgi:hypothetical protein